MTLDNMFQKSKLEIIIILVLFAIVVFIGAWWLVSRNSFQEPAVRDPEIEEIIKTIEITKEMLDLITPPEDAVPIEITQEMLDLITPPEDAVPIEITQEMLDLITPPGVEPLDVNTVNR